MYVTGGFGPSASNEGFTSDYDLPNDTAYAETCASVAMIFWAQRMLNLDLDGQYADVLELALYNGALSGLSRDGEHYFYENQLESDGTPPALGLAPLPVLHDERLAPRRLDRRLLLLDRRGRDRDAPLRRQRRRARGRRPRRSAIEETSSYPWSGRIRIAVAPGGAADRSASSCASPAGRAARPPAVNGEPVDVGAATTRGYLDITREWSGGRHRRARPADAARARLRQPEGADGSRPGHAAPRAAGLLPGAGRQSRTPRSAQLAPAARAPRSRPRSGATSSTAS